MIGIFKLMCTSNEGFKRRLMKRLMISASGLVCLFCLAGICWAEGNEYTPQLLRVGYSTKFLGDVSLADAKVAIELWTKEMSKSSLMKMQPKTFIFDDLQTMVTALKNRDIDMVTLTAMDYIKIKDRVAIDPTLVASKRGAVGGDELCLIVRRDQGMTDVKHLRGKRLIMHAYMLDSAYLWLNTIIYRDKRSQKEKFFSSIQEVSKATQAVLPVFFKQADAVVVSKSTFETMAELNPQLAKEMMIIHSSEKLMYGMICINRSLNSAIKKDVLYGATNMQRSSAGKQILTLFQIEHITTYKPAMLQNTLILLNGHAVANKTGL